MLHLPGLCPNVVLIISQKQLIKDSNTLFFILTLLWLLFCSLLVKYLLEKPLVVFNQASVFDTFNPPLENIYRIILLLTLLLVLFKQTITALNLPHQNAAEEMVYVPLSSSLTVTGADFFFY